MKNDSFSAGANPVPRGTPELSGKQEYLLRHIRSAWLDNNVLSKQNFLPLPKDKSHLSTERESLITAKDSHARWIGWGRDSVAVFGVRVGDFQRHNAPCFHVPTQENPEHALVRYPSVGSQAKRLAEKIKKVAVKRYQP